MEADRRTRIGLAIEAVCAVLLAIVGLLADLSEPVEVSRERQQRQAQRVLASQCADGDFGKLMTSPAPGWAGVCATLSSDDLSIPVDRFPAGEALAGRYLESLRTMLLSLRGPLHQLPDSAVATINSDAVYAEGIRTVARHTGSCGTAMMGSVSKPLPDGGLRLLRLHTIGVTMSHPIGDPVELRVTILEGFAACVVTGSPADRFVLGSVDATMWFRATSSGWKLQKMSACPRLDEPGMERFARSGADESVFRFIGDGCPNTSAPPQN